MPLAQERADEQIDDGVLAHDDTSDVLFDAAAKFADAGNVHPVDALWQIVAGRIQDARYKMQEPCKVQGSGGQRAKKEASTSSQDSGRGYQSHAEGADAADPGEPHRDER